MSNPLKTSVNGANPLAPRVMLESKYKTARYNLLLAVAFTVINIILALTASDTYLLFSAFVPYFMVYMGMVLCGKFPPEFYEALELELVEAWDSSLLIIMIVLAIMILAMYVLCFVMSGKYRSGWFTVALVLFIIDTVLLLVLNGISGSIVDILFHAWVIYYLIVGISSVKKLKALPPDEPAEPVAQSEGEESAVPSAEAAQEQTAEIPDAWAELNERVENDQDAKEE